MTVLLTTQYMEEADRLAHRLAIIDQGRIVSEGSPAALKAMIGGDVVTIAVAAIAAMRGLDGVREVRSDDAGLTLFVEDGPDGDLVGSVDADARVSRRDGL